MQGVAPCSQPEDESRRKSLDAFLYKRLLFLKVMVHVSMTGEQGHENKFHC
jgi:hypothetical protein